MGKKKASKPAATSLAMAPPRGWLFQQNEDFWIRLQVYPDAIWHAETGEEYEHKAKVVVQKSGLANLRYLCNSAGISYRSEHDSAEQLASLLLSSDSRKEVIYLATFLRTRKTAVVEYFEEATTDHDRASLDSEIATLSARRPETLKPLTKLIWLYRSNSSLLEAIHFRHAWRRLPTVFSYSVPNGLPSGSLGLMSGSLETLVKELNRLKPGESYESFGCSTLAGTTTVFVVHRCFPPSVRSDYQQTFRLQHDFSIVAFAVDETNSSILVKVANRSVAEVIRDWVTITLGITLLNTGTSPFSNYCPESVESAFLGGYDESHGIDLIGITLRHSFGPNHSPITLAAADFSRSIREDLSWLKQSQVIRLRSLAEIQSFKLRYEGHEIDVLGVTEKGGSVRFRLNDAGLTEAVAASLRNTFQLAFMVPLDQSIDPTLLAMGPSDIYHYLLSGLTEDQVQPYQREWLAKLIERGLLVTVVGKTGRCTDMTCSSHSQAVSDESLTECPTCQGPISWQEFRRYEEDKKSQSRVVREFLQKATGWKLDPTPHSFESQKFLRLSSPKNPGRTVCIFLNDRLNSGKLETFHRAMFPLIVVHPLGQQSLPVIDPVGIAHIGLPYLIAANDTDEDWKKFRAGCKDVLSRLLRMEKERILRTSRHSYDLLQSKANGYNDRNYEADVFNLLRSLFSFTVKWGGGNKPDGFSSLVYFPDNDLRKPQKFNWSYDAKFSETTYAFEIGEFRQMYDYVRRLHAPKSLKSLGNSYDAHVIITNAMEEQAMKNAAAYMATQHRLGTETPEFSLVFMWDSFLTKLWELIRGNEAEFEKRSTYLAEFFVSIIRDGMHDGYCLLDGTVAIALAKDVLAENPVQEPVDAGKIKDDLKKQSRPTAISPARTRRKSAG